MKNTEMMDEIQQQSEIRKRLTIAKKNHPDCVVVYFVRHKDAPQDLPKPKIPLLLFKRDLKVEQVFYALFDQIQYKGLAFYVLKSEPNNKIRYLMLTPGLTIGKVFDQFSKNDYLALIYHNTNIGKKKITTLERRIIRYTILIAIILIALYGVPYISEYFFPVPQNEKIQMPVQFQQS